MHKSIKIVFVSLILLFSLTLHAQVTFNRGVNLTGWFQTSNTKQIQFSKYTKQDFENIKSLGCDVIRLPINLFYMTSGKPDYKVDTLFFEFLDAAVDWAEELNIYLIIDNHTIDDIASKNPDLESVLTNVWTQITQHYKNRSTYILYEIMNEPNGITTQVWGNIQQSAIDAIRTVDTTHTLIVGPSSFNSYNDLNLLPVYTDSKLIYTFHFYDPFIFTHQGATWPTPSLGPLAGVPFPYNADSMPVFPDALKDTWVEDAFNGYNVDGTVAKVHELIDKAVSFKNTRNVPVYCGEFGVYMPYSKNADRVYWYNQVRKYLEVNGILWTTWDYQGNFGLFKAGSNEMFDYDLNIPLVDSLGLVVPPQMIYELKPDTVGFNIFSDYIGEKIFEASLGTGSIIDFYSGDKPNNGKYCISWTGSAQYGAIGFNLSPDKDLSQLEAENYALSLIVRGNAPGTNIEIRFIDSKTSEPDDHPWRMNYTINDNIVPWDSRWHKVYIPLSDFIDMGSWDNAWFTPIGAFDWKAVDRFEIVTDQGSLLNKNFWFDNIYVANLDTANIFDTSAFIVPVVPSLTASTSTSGLNIYPNPVKEMVTIEYSLKQNENISIGIYNLSGQKIKTLVNENQPNGSYRIQWDTSDDNGNMAPDGVYICHVVTSGKTSISRIALIRTE